MPPKPRGQSSTRARGSARGGANTGRATASASTEDATPQTTAATEKTAEQDEDDLKPAVTGEGITATTESQPSPQADASCVYHVPFSPQELHC